MPRAVPQAALDLVKTSEGFISERSPDPIGLPTIGYGHKLKQGDPLWDATIDESHAEALADDDLERVAIELTSVLGPSQVSLFTDGQWSALLDFTFNLGIGAFEGSTLCAMLKAGHTSTAGAQFERWVYAGNPPQKLPGLVTRRAAEADLWLS
jgi:lysozyme